MNTPLRRCSALTVAAAFVLGACSQDLPERTFKSDAEGFAVDFPGTPQIVSGKDQHWSVKAFQVGERVGEGGLLFSVNLARLAIGGTLVVRGIEPLTILRGQVDSFCKSLGGTPEGISVSETKFDNRYPALEYSCGIGRGEMTFMNEGWMILQPDRVVRISVSYSEGLRETASLRFREFLKSLALR